MAAYVWVNILKDVQTTGTIPAKTLSHMPKLKDADWSKVEFLGRVEHSFSLTKLDGALVIYSGVIYYINMNQVKIVAKTYKWNIDKRISVKED